MRIFVIHYKKLVNRKKHILEQFQKHNITDYEFVEIDRDELDNQNISKFKENYNKSQIAISLSHFYAYRQISEKYECGLIFEDDVILHKNFIKRLHKYLNKLPTDYDMLFIGDGCNLHIQPQQIVPKKFIYKKGLHPTSWGGNGVTRCTDSYLVSKKCATKIWEHIDKSTNKIDSAIDWWLNETARANKFAVYWAEPTIATQGTKNGNFERSHTNY